MGKAMKINVLRKERDQLKVLSDELAMLVRLLVEGLGGKVVLEDSVQRRVIDAPPEATDVHLSTEDGTLVLQNRMGEYLEELTRATERVGGVGAGEAGAPAGEGVGPVDPEGAAEEHDRAGS